jgi:hypothetical protein
MLIKSHLVDYISEQSDVTRSYNTNSTLVDMLEKNSVVWKQWEPQKAKNEIIFFYKRLSAIEVNGMLIL